MNQMLWNEVKSEQKDVRLTLSELMTINRMYIMYNGLVEDIVDYIVDHTSYDYNLVSEYINESYDNINGKHALDGVLNMNK